MNQGDVSALVDEIEAAWNSHDMSRFAACFTADADFVNVAIHLSPAINRLA